MSTDVLHALDRDDWWVPPLGSPLDMQTDEEVEAVYAAARAAGTHPCFVYRYFDYRCRLLYVGITIDLAGRLSGHKSKQSIFLLFAKCRTAFVYPSEAAARRAETRAINTEYPIFNIQERDHEVSLALRRQYLSCSAIQWIAAGKRDIAPGYVQ